MRPICPAASRKTIAAMAMGLPMPAGCQNGGWLAQGACPAAAPVALPGAWPDAPHGDCHPEFWYCCGLAAVGMLSLM